jgi:bifunctional ADP-heptose synthase (sugar kinase/adenylyltransferase)
MLTLSRLESLLQAYPHLRLGLVGDLFLDRYLELAPGIVELSIETGLEAYQIPQVRNSPGAMGTVLNNLAALGVQHLFPISVIGDDGQGFDLLKELRRLPVDPSFVITDSNRLTPTYTKPMRQAVTGDWVELNRLDLRSREPISPATTAALCRNLQRAFATVDGLIVLDQINEHNWGVVNDEVRGTLQALQRADPRKLIYVDSRRHLGRFEFGVLKGNRSEVLVAVGSADESFDSVQRALTQLAERTGRPCFCTLGAEGILVARPGESPQRVPGCQVTGPIDIVGAGDAATSGIVTSLLCGASELEAARIGNLVASITIQQLGTTGTASPAQVLARFREAENQEGVDRRGTG